MTKLFEIIKYSSTEVYVAVTTIGTTNTFWHSLEKELRRLNRGNVTVYLDFVLRHGLDNRFFTTDYENDSLKYGVKKLTSYNSIESIFNKYFSTRLHLINQSMMTTREKSIFINMLLSKS